MKLDPQSLGALASAQQLLLQLVRKGRQEIVLRQRDDSGMDQVLRADSIQPVVDADLVDLVATDATAAAQLPDWDGYAAALTNFRMIATTLRTVKSATINDWGAICWKDGELHEAIHRPDLAIFDRVGGGDSFASGLIYGLMEDKDPGAAVNYGAAHGALAMTTPGDTTTASLSEVEKVMKGAGARVDR